MQNSLNHSTSREINFMKSTTYTAALLLGLVTVLTTVSGCATKHYGRQGDVTPYEKTTLTCREIALETAKIDGFIAQVDTESQFSGRSVLSFLGDFGIGNVLEKDAAIKSANDRRRTLNNLAAQKGCNSTTLNDPSAVAF
jgi:hypothetical protein